MPDETNPSSGGSVTPTPETPVSGTPAPSGATPEKASLTVEELLKRNADLEISHKNAREQADRQAKKLAAYEKAEKEAETARQAAKDAELGELERERKQRTAAEARVQQQQQQLVMAQVKLVAKDKGIINPELIAPVVERKLEYDKDGEPTNLEAVLDELIKGNPYLVKPAEPGVTPAQTATPPAQQQAPALPPFAGRSSIPGPGTLPTGKPFTLNDYTWKK